MRRHLDGFTLLGLDRCASVGGVGHRQRRRVLAPIVAKGLVDCARCGEPIEPGEPWDLGHDDFDRSRYLGPEHRRCNRAAPNQLRVSRDW